MERRLSLHAGSRALAVALAVAGATSAHAAPRGVDAKAQFDRGAGAYNNNDYAEASEAFAKSFALEPDSETLFAWAQAERKLGHCGKAIELYDKLLVMQLPSENREAVTKLRAECQQLTDQLATAHPPPSEPEHRASPPERPPVDKSEHWWQDGFGDTLLVVGVAGLAVGGVFLVQAHSADQDKATATNYFDYKADSDRADSRGTLGVISAAAGGVVFAASIVNYIAHGHSSSPAASASAWVTPTGGGLVWSGRF